MVNTFSFTKQDVKNLKLAFICKSMLLLSKFSFSVLRNWMGSTTKKNLLWHRVEPETTVFWVISPVWRRSTVQPYQSCSSPAVTKVCAWSRLPRSTITGDKLNFFTPVVASTTYFEHIKNWCYISAVYYVFLYHLVNVIHCLLDIWRICIVKCWCVVIVLHSWNKVSSRVLSFYLKPLLRKKHFVIRRYCIYIL